MTGELGMVFFQGYLAGVVFGSLISVTLYRALAKTGKLGAFAEDKLGSVHEEMMQ